MTDQVLWFQVQMNSYSSNWNTLYKSLIVTAGEFQKCNLVVRTLRRTICNKIMFKTWKKCQKDSRKTGSLWEMMRGVGGVRKSIHQSWLAKELGLGLGLLCWGFKGVQEEIPSQEGSTLQIASMAFPPGQYTSPWLHPCHRLFDQDEHQESSSASL